MNTIKPIGADVLVGPLPKRTHSDGGIVLPQQYQDDSKQHLVLAVGPKVKESEIQVGRRCILDPGVLGVRHIEDGTRRMIVRSDKILAVW